ncbi:MULTISPECIES: hypothetical protein [Streptacidiphilus]|uniref:NERD domain-containing protein n=1 Tax=Streptacidiphilus cavernicola TaxID=3342716 RepID=A0ABV6UWD9_9ACTN|nr:hypothetical protein [Streptacidiphilus jeojiense]
MSGRSNKEIKELADAAEARVQRYLEERGYAFEHEPDLGITKNPDFLVTAAEAKVVLEVKAFDTFGMFETLPVGASVGSRSMEEALKPVRRQISKAAGQLKELADSGMPLVVVLDNPAGRPVPLNSYSVVAAMYGDPEVTGTLGPNGGIEDWRWSAGRNGKLTMDHSYVSAVAVLRREDHGSLWVAQWMDEHRAEYDRDSAEFMQALVEASKEAPVGDEVFFEVFETVSESAVPLPRDVFNGPRDLRWGPTPGRDGLTPV